MSWQDLENLLTNIANEINTANAVQLPSEIWNRYRTEITALSTSSVAEQVVRLSSSPNVLSLKPVEAARILSLLKQRRRPAGNARPLIGKIRTAVVARTRPPFNVPVSSLIDEQQQIALIGGKPQYSRFQIEGWSQALETLRNRSGLVVVAPTGAGKSEVFMLPVIYEIARSIASGSSLGQDPRFVMLYPRVTLLKDQLERIFRYTYSAERSMLSAVSAPRGQRVRIPRNIIIGFQFEGIWADNQKTLDDIRVFENGLFKVVETCPICNSGQLGVQQPGDNIVTLRCTNSRNCTAAFRVTISKAAHVEVKPHILVTTEESLSRFFLTPRRAYDDYLRSISGIIYDEAHLHYGLKGAHLFNLIRNIESLQSPNQNQPAIAKIASSATITNPDRFAAKLFYGDETQLVPVHDAAQFESEPSGLEVLFFLQSPNQDQSPPPTSTMIQTAMGIGHAIFNEDKRAILFTDSVDMASRFRSQIQDAESATRLWDFRTVLPNLEYNRQTCPGTDPARCSSLYQNGECWRGIIGGENCTAIIPVRENPLNINVVSSKTRSNYWEGEIVVATSSLEVGVDDDRIKATLHYRPPRDVFSFIQRRGRAGRSRNDIAYSVMVLGNDAPDQFYLYRRNRLLSAGSYELPFNPNNTVIAAMHRTLAEERARMRDFIRRFANSRRSGTKRGVLVWVFLTLKRCPVINRYYATRLDEIENLNNADNEGARSAMPGGVDGRVGRELWKIKPAQPEDALIIYFAGHGTSRGQRFYLLPRNFAGAGEQSLIEQGISDIDLNNVLEGVGAGRVVMVIDACQSGQALGAEREGRAPMNSKGLAQLAYNKGMSILTAAQSQQAALEAVQINGKIIRHGLLTYALLQGLTASQADKDGNRQLWEREWLDYASEQVPLLQLEAMRQRHAQIEQTGRDTEIFYSTEDDKNAPPENRTIQRPRLFYRREAEAGQMIIAKP